MHVIGGNRIKKRGQPTWRLRQYFPKRTEIAHYTQAELDAVAAELNGRPRQTLGFTTPSQALDEALR